MGLVLPVDLQLEAQLTSDSRVCSTRYTDYCNPQEARSRDSSAQFGTSHCGATSFKLPTCMNTGKQQKPVLTGQRFKTRKRDEKEKFEPTVFRDTIVAGLNEAGGDLEAVAKFLDTTGSRLDYRRYADTLFDILIAGSMLEHTPCQFVVHNNSRVVSDVGLQMFHDDLFQLGLLGQEGRSEFEIPTKRLLQVLDDTFVDLLDGFHVRVVGLSQIESLQCLLDQTFGVDVNPSAPDNETLIAGAVGICWSMAAASAVVSRVLAPGGTRIDEGDKTKVTVHCVFTTEESHAALRLYAQVFNKLIRRYKYLEKAFEEEIKKLLLFLKAFSESEQTKLAMLTGILLANNILPPPIINSLFTESVVKEGISALFAVKMFKAWIAEKDANSVTSALRKANLDKRLLELFPASKQNVEHFSKYFNEAGLKELSDFLHVQQSLGTRKELQRELQERLSQQCPIREMVVYVKEEMKRNELQEQAVIGLLWTCLMNAVEWNKKEELVTEQALKHLKHYAPLLAVFSTQGQSELVLLLKIQEYCYDNIHFMKSFSKIVVLFYKADVLSEEAILKWYKDAHAAKGKSVFLEQMKKFVEWLQNAEEGNYHTTSFSPSQKERRAEGALPVVCLLSPDCAAAACEP
ncbi:hypothetical protein INR49_027323, partial [Caranx melampygus]